MNRIEKTLITFFLVGVLTLSILTQAESVSDVFKSVVLFLTYGTLFIIMVCYLFRSKWSFYSLILILLILELVGTILKTHHWHEANVFLSLGLFSYPFIMIFLIRTAILNLADKRFDTTYNFILAGLILFQIVIVIFYHDFLWLGQLINYASLGVILTMKLKRIVLNEFESYILTILALKISMIIIPTFVKDLFELTFNNIQ